MTEHKARVRKVYWRGHPWKWTGECSCGWRCLSWSWSRKHEQSSSGLTPEEWTEEQGRMPEGGAYVMTLEHVEEKLRRGGKQR